MNKRIAITLTVLFTMCSTFIIAQTVTGVWKTIDDKTGNPVSYVTLYKEDGVLYGKVIKLLPDATVTHCKECEGDKKGDPIVGMTILWGMKPYKDYWSYGTILDPKSGNEYKCSIWLKSDDTLKVRGYIGISWIGRTQEWYRVKE